ncbi:MAG: membrane protein insertase YidC [candidate division WOR-3 bacterium]|nr:membrane protein insertase YidC [candidate division WOR-3 bacterium]
MDDSQRRTIIAFLLIIAILFIWSLISYPSGSGTKKEDRVADTVKVAVSSEEGLIPEGDTIVIERNAYRAVFSTAGGGIKRFYLKNYDAELIPEGGALFITKIADSILSCKHYTEKDSLVFFAEIKGKKYEKIYHFNEDGFVIKVNFPDTIAHILSLKSGLRITEEKNQGDDLRYFNVYIQSVKFNSIIKDIKDKFSFKDEWQWIALRTKYFVMIINNLEDCGTAEFYRLSKSSDECNTAFINCAAGGNTNRYGIEILNQCPFKISVLVLPVKFTVLARYRQNYEQIESGGIWGPIARIIIFILNTFYSFMKNYGLAIILFALLFKIIFFPLSRQMIISQRQMQLLQPELKKIQEKYKNDPQTLNREMLHLYRVYRINPFSGCLPLLIQLPIFFALYQVFTTAIEFRRAPFVLWITDLSFKDPYYVLPIAMGILMLIQSLMTPIDPRQRFMVIMMPLIMIFVFLNFPSGLQLYWFIYNILSIVENLLIKKKILH